MRKTAIVAGGAALAIGLAGCGGGTTAGKAQPLFGNAQELVQAASSKTSAAKSAKMTMEMSMGGMTIKSDGAVRFAGENTAMSMTMDMMGKTMEMRLVDKTMYIKQPPGTRSGSASGKPWVKKPLNSGSGMVTQFSEQVDPTKILQRIQKAGKITKKEQGKLNGQPVSHYWIDLQLSKMQDMMPGSMSKQIPGNVLNKLKDVAMPMQLWLNSDNLPVKMTMDLSAMMNAMFKAMQEQAPQGEAGGKMMDAMKKMFKDMSITATYSDWGEPVNITAPPADKVTTAEKTSPSSPGGSGMFPGMPN